MTQNELPEDYLRIEPRGFVMIVVASRTAIAVVIVLLAAGTSIATPPSIGPMPTHMMVSDGVAYVTWGGPARAPLIISAIDLATAKIVWTIRGRGRQQISLPVLHGRLYVLMDSSAGYGLHIISTKTGLTERVIPYSGKDFSRLITNGSYLVTRDGTVIDCRTGQITTTLQHRFDEGWMSHTHEFYATTCSEPNGRNPKRFLQLIQRIDLATGKIKATYRFSSSAGFLTYNFPNGWRILAARNAVVLLFRGMHPTGCDILAYDFSAGKVLWRTTLKPCPNSERFHFVDDHTLNLIPASRPQVFGSPAKALLLDMRTGARRVDPNWKDPRAIFGRGLKSLKGTGGGLIQIVWDQDTIAAIIHQTHQGDDKEYRLVCVDASTGKLRSWAPIDYSIITSDPLYRNNYHLTVAGRFVTFVNKAGLHIFSVHTGESKTVTPQDAGVPVYKSHCRNFGDPRFRKKQPEPPPDPLAQRLWFLRTTVAVLVLMLLATVGYVVMRLRH